MNKKTLLGAGIALALGLPLAGQAQVLFDADGDFNDLNDDDTLTESFDLLPGNALALDVVPIMEGDTFTLLYHAEMVEIIRATAMNVDVPVGPDGPAELTAVAELQEEVLLVTDIPGGAPGVPESAFFSHLGGTFNIYYDNFTGGTINADDETTNGGLGYADGTLILSGVVVPATVGAQFTVSDDSGTDPLDGFGPNGVPTATTVAGLGSTDLFITVSVLGFDPAFFPNGISTLEFSSNLRLNFNTINNSVVFERLDGLANEVPDYGGGPLTGVNGRFVAGETIPQDFQFLADGSASLAPQQVPEPTSLTLLGLGLGGIGLFGIVGSRRRKAA